MNHILEPLKQSWRVLIAAGIVIGIATALLNWGFSRHEIISLFSLIGIAVLISCLVVAGRQLGENELRRRASFVSLDHGLKMIYEKLTKNNPSNPGNPGNFRNTEMKPTTQPPELKPTGGGAFAGMIVGGAIGSIGGPVGVIIGGVLGALLGNQAEYENIHRKKPPLE